MMNFKFKARDLNNYRMILVWCLFVFNIHLLAKQRYLEAEVKELSGRVEILKENSTTWTMLNKEMACGNNEKIIVNPNASLTLALPDGSRMIFRENSKFLFNSSEMSDLGNANKILTLYYGGVFCITRKTLENYEGHYLKVFTPTLVGVTKSGSFLVEADRKTGISKVFVVRGTLEVNNLKGVKMQFLREGISIKIDGRGEFSDSEEFEDGVFIRESKWLGKDFLEKELLRGKLERKRKQDVITGKSLGRIVVMDFTTLEKSPSPGWNVPRFFSGFVARQLAEASFREVILSRGVKDDPIAFGRAQEADRVITGRVKKFELKKKAVLNDDSTKYELHLKAKLEVELTVLNPTSGDTLKVKTFKTEWVAKRAPEEYMNRVLKQPLNEENEIIKSSVLGRALEDVGSSLRKFARSAL